jgi:hypothetical protein
MAYCRQRAHSRAAWRNRKRRHRLMERSFADAANNHYFKRAPWRRLWRQQIQGYLIASIQNVRILLTHQNPKQSAAVVMKLLSVDIIAAISNLPGSPNYYLTPELNLLLACHSAQKNGPILPNNCVLGNTPFKI